jgi:hypothetical protein
LAQVLRPQVFYKFTDKYPIKEIGMKKFIAIEKFQSRKDAVLSTCGHFNYLADSKHQCETEMVKMGGRVFNVIEISREEFESHQNHSRSKK